MLAILTSLPPFQNVPLSTSPKKLGKMSLETDPTTQLGHSSSAARIHV